MTLQRISELVLARYNTVRLLTRGALEIAPGHYWLLVAMHGAWLVALWIWGRNQPVNLLWLSVFVILQVLRVWVNASLGSNWTTRIIVLPGAPLVSTGAYRFMSHPNYVVVACEKSPGTGDRGLSDAGQAGKGPATRREARGPPACLLLRHPPRSRV